MQRLALLPLATLARLLPEAPRPLVVAGLPPPELADVVVVPPAPLLRPPLPHQRPVHVEPPPGVLVLGVLLDGRDVAHPVVFRLMALRPLPRVLSELPRPHDVELGPQVVAALPPLVPGHPHPVPQLLSVPFSRGRGAARLRSFSSPTEAGPPRRCRRPGGAPWSSPRGQGSAVADRGVATPPSKPARGPCCHAAVAATASARGPPGLISSWATVGASSSVCG